MRRTFAIVLILTALFSAAFAGADWKKAERPAKVSLYDVMKEIQANRQSIQVIKQEFNELRSRLAKVELQRPSPSDKTDKLEARISWLEKRVDALTSTLSILWGILAVVVLVVIGIAGYLIYNFRRQKA